jgi:hypothetical protein
MAACWFRRAELGLVTLLLASCAWEPSSNWYLMDSGYSIDAVEPGEFVMELHLNQLRQLGGEISGPRVRLFVAERLQWHGMCPAGWAFLPCIEDGSCVQRTHRSVTVAGRCTAL